MIESGDKHDNPNPNPEIGMLDYWSWMQYSLHIKHSFQDISNQQSISLSVNGIPIPHTCCMYNALKVQNVRTRCL
jgi:hypothetical protein